MFLSKKQQKRNKIIAKELADCAQLKIDGLPSCHDMALQTEAKKEQKAQIFSGFFLLTAM